VDINEDYIDQLEKRIEQLQKSLAVAQVYEDLVDRMFNHIQNKIKSAKNGAGSLAMYSKKLNTYFDGKIKAYEELLDTFTRFLEET
jgi:hypothetical protein